MTETKYYPMAEAVRAAYANGEEDEALEPIVRVNSDGELVGRIQDGDYVIFYDIRGEREIELTSAFVASDFPHFSRKSMQVHFATMIEYAKDLPVKVAFPPLGAIHNTLSEVVSTHGLKQVKVTESEKSIHVSYFLNGKREQPFPGERHIFISSPEVDNYAEIPHMSAPAVADAVVAVLQDPEPDLVVVNFVNVDVVGHIENHDAVLQAVETVDQCVGKVVAAAQTQGITPVIVADHGTVERWLYPDGTVDTGHTDNLVPFVIAEPGLKNVTLYPGNSLTDVAPTILHLMGLPKPNEMTGNSLLPEEAITAWAVNKERRRILLIIADGWGIRDEAWGNMIMEANTPNMDTLQTEWPHTRLQAAGPAVGMPEGTVGNSESGHTHIGAGRRILADRVCINESLADGSFFENEAFLWAMRGAKRDGTRLHLLGIVSFYSSHGSVDHLLPLLEMARREGIPEVYHHGMLGRRGERLGSGAHYIELVEKETEKLGVGVVASVIGRFWSLDREENWDRIEKTYRWLVEGQGTHVRAE
ncbi:MAG: alkaline phosphatase family protein [Anaerolineae bacterium]|nr:alkaline phosphatase family protein [Anaerolineae bacterium]